MRYTTFILAIILLLASSFGHPPLTGATLFLLGVAGTVSAWRKELV